MSESLFNKVAGLHLASLLKKTLVQVFSCEVCKTFFTEHLRKAAPVLSKEIKPL